MASIRLIVTDLDGTFLRDVHSPHPENVRAMRACQDAGIPVCAVTGRNWSEARRIIVGVGFDRFCGINNGTAIIDARTGEIRYRNRFHPDDARKLVELVYAMDGVSFYASGSVHMHQVMNRVVAEADLPLGGLLDTDAMGSVILYDDLFGMLGKGCEDVQRLHIELPYANAELRKRIHDGISAIVAADITNSGDSGMDVMPKDASKADALGVLADIYNVKMNNVMAFGDSENDMAMLRAAGIGVAMQNGDEALKRAADMVAPPNTEGGVARIIYNTVLSRRK
jgi:hypothetical protein